MIVLRDWGQANGQFSPGQGQYLKAFDFEAHGGIGEAFMTRDPTQAMQFENIRDAMEFYSRSPECKPLRDDGRPNRPLTAVSWEFLPVDKALASVDG